MNWQPPAAVPDWSGCRTMLGLNRADASKEYSCRKYAPISLGFRQNRMRLQRPLHLGGTPLEDFEQVPMPTFEVFQYVGQLLLGGIGVEAQYSTDDVIGARLVGGLENPGLGRRLERPHHDPGGVRPQIHGLSI